LDFSERGGSAHRKRLRTKIIPRKRQRRTEPFAGEQKSLKKDSLETSKFTAWKLKSWQLNTHFDIIKKQATVKFNLPIWAEQRRIRQSGNICTGKIFIFIVL
jgi:hypothetical protein